jgi:pyruvate dehydrogenase E2 component (dihydrolipoamide acetyltransferase)
MGYILAEGEEAPPVGADAPDRPAAATGAPAIRERTVRTSGEIRATPAARRLAAQAGVDLAQLVGTGPGGRIVETDVLAHVPEQQPTRGAQGQDGYRAGQRVALSRTRRMIGARLRHALATAASTTLTREADADLLLGLRQRVAKGMDDAPSYDALFVRLFAAALRRCPELTAIVDGESLVVQPEIHVGFAVPAPSGLVVPVVRSADAVSFPEVVRTVRELTERAHEGRLRLEDTEGGTATITNLGAHGVDAFTPILNPPQSVILGIGRIAPRPVVRDGRLDVGRTCTLSLTFDHRVTDGVPAARLLAETARLMNDRLFLDSLC